MSIAWMNIQYFAEGVGDYYDIISTLLTDCDKLRCLNLTTFDSSIFSKVKSSLCSKKRKQVKWESFKLRMVFDDTLNAKKLEENCMEIADLLRECVSADFVLSLTFKTENETEARGIVEALHSPRNSLLYRIDLRQRNGEKGWQTQIIIVNKDNAMCGYAEKWMYRCSACEDWGCDALGW